MGEDAGGLGLRFKTHTHTRARARPARPGPVRFGSDWIGLDLDKACLQNSIQNPGNIFSQFTESVLYLFRDCSKRCNVLKHRDSSNRSVVLNRHCTGSNSHFVPINWDPQTAKFIQFENSFFSPSVAISYHSNSCSREVQTHCLVRRNLPV